MSQLIIIMGVSGSGKTTVGQSLAQELNLSFFDADDFHSASNKEKMSSGIPLTDQDRIPWLETLHNLCSSYKEKGLVLACSALKHSYRVLLSENLTIEWVYLKGSFELIYSRMHARTTHFMPPNLLQNQFDILEEPTDAYTVSINQSVESIVSALVHHI